MGVTVSLSGIILASLGPLRRSRFLFSFGPTYIRHDENGDRTVTREAYAEELAGVHKARRGIRVVVYDHSFTSDRAWFRFSFQWPDQRPEKKQSRDAELPR